MFTIAWLVNINNNYFKMKNSNNNLLFKSEGKSAVTDHLKCCFLLAEAPKKQKMFFSHTSGSLGASVQGGGVGHMAYEISHFSCCRSPLPHLPLTHPYSFFEFLDSFSISCLLQGDLFVFSLCVTVVFILFFPD